MTTNKLYIYFQERFPLPGALFISVSFALLALSPASSISSGSWLPTFAALVMFFLALLLRQRVTDEFKDMSHDAQHYPDRPYQRGLVTRNELFMLFSIALVLEVSLAYILSGKENYGWYLLVFVYSLLMAKEFFAAKWFEKHFTSYFLVHEVIFVLIAAWVAVIMKLPDSAESFSWAVAFLAIMMSIEIARKFERRRDKKGKEVRDTYTSVWGETITRRAIELLVLTSGIALAYAEQSIGFVLIAAPVSLALNLLRPKTSIIQVALASYVLVVGIFGVLL